ncbi:MAG: GNAT family N-acetyltransferase [Planctomycetes bacterium]|nr:GNAT family N-acetyltransferase [Planctomycetota bacterium]
MISAIEHDPGVRAHEPTMSIVDSRSLQYVHELDAWLRPDVPWSIIDEFPRAFGPDTRAKSTCLLHRGRLVAHAATLDVAHVDGTDPDDKHETTLRIVSSVVVRPDCRGQGFGKKLIHSVVEDFRQSAASVLLLWSERHRFYAGFGFEPWGVELRVEPVPAHPTRPIRPMRLSDVEAVMRLHASKPLHVERNATDFADALRIPRTAAFVLEGRDHEPLAYAFVGKGLDFPGIAHDVGGSTEDLAELLRALPMAFAILPYWQLELAQAVGRITPHPLGLAITKAAVAPHRGWAVEGLDSM